ncbi:MAG: hypothetical protein AAF609_02875 [Cyanobacteria bacterium P01_C01_bin.120]
MTARCSANAQAETTFIRPNSYTGSSKTRPQIYRPATLSPCHPITPSSRHLTPPSTYRRHRLSPDPIPETKGIPV